MTKHYFVIKQHSWGADKNLHQALLNCSIRYDHPYNNAIDSLSYVDLESNKTDLEDLQAELAYHREEGCQEEGITEFHIIISDADQWKFTTADEVNGSPSYKWIGKGDKPEGLVPTKRLKIELDNETGFIKLIE